MRTTILGAAHSRPSLARIALLVGPLLLPGPIARTIALCGSGGVRQDQAGQIPAKRTMSVMVLGVDEKPLAGAKIHAAIWAKEPKKSNRDYVCDEDGIAFIDLPSEIKILRLWASKDGHAAMFANWWPEQEAKPREIPREFSFHLEKGTVIGGSVQNEDGEPIAGAVVSVRLVNPNGEIGLDQHPIPNIWLADAEKPVKTDARGRWMLDNVPAGDDFDFLVMLNHPDYVSDYIWGGLQKEQKVGAVRLRERAAIMVMHRGNTLSGVVTDEHGKAIPDAVVIWGDDPYIEEGSQEVRTDAKGRYEFPPLPEGTVRLTAVARGWMPYQRSVDIVHADTSADIELRPGKKLRLRFVDREGKAIPGVGVGIEGWRGGKALYNHRHPNVLDTKIPVSADENGVYEWAWAPEDAVTFYFYKEGYRPGSRLEVVADSNTEYKVTLNRE